MRVELRKGIEIVEFCGSQQSWSNSLKMGLAGILLLFLAFSPRGTAFGGALSLEGPIIQGGLVQGKTSSGAQVKINGNPVRVSPQGTFLVGFGRDASDKVNVEVIYEDGNHEKRVLAVQRRTYKIQRINGLPSRKVNPKKEDLTRIKREVERTKEARKRDDPRTDFANGFIWPALGKITGVYGSQRILNGEPRRPHYGVDISAPVGTIVVAPASGLVTLVHPDMFFSGGTMILDHGHGLSSAFLHLNKILVKEGAYVRQGEPIAEIGATGRVTGPHLDWRMNLFQQRLDPELLVGSMP